MTNIKTFSDNHQMLWLTPKDKSKEKTMKTLKLSTSYFMNISQQTFNHTLVSYMKKFRAKCKTSLVSFDSLLNPLSANRRKWSMCLTKLPTNCLSVFDHFVGLALKGLQESTLLLRKLSLALEEDQKHRSE